MSAVAVGLLTALFVAGCAPSIRMVHRSRAYFERCYAADFDPQIRRTERHACWVAWLDHYTSGQPRERVMYARTRAAAQGIENDSLAMPGVERASESATYARAAHVRIDAAPLPNAAVPDAAPGANQAPPTTASVVEVTLTNADSGVAAVPPTLEVTATVRPPRGQPSIPPPPPPAVPRRGSLACSPVCDPRFVSCVELCDPAHPDPCRDACTAEHRACGNACL